MTKNLQRLCTRQFIIINWRYSPTIIVILWLNNLSIDLFPFTFFILTKRLFSARSTKGITRLSPSERAAIKLPEEVKELLIGYY